eukprot:m.105543 g.105543  ORF g.105543 m.105543 type:complete len:70 (-) comp9133_c0_seq7:1726-1935(-)
MYARDEEDVICVCFSKEKSVLQSKYTSEECLSLVNLTYIAWDQFEYHWIQNIITLALMKPCNSNCFENT